MGHNYSVYHTGVTERHITRAIVHLQIEEEQPFCKGKPGSEFRLLTVALMLGNKCEYLSQTIASGLAVLCLLTLKLVLDDNTYTNKTWAEVSGISVQEIHIMEVEF